MPFAHERLHVYQLAINFVVWADDLITAMPTGAAVKNQLDRASTSVPLNIAEGNAKFSTRDRVRYLQIACGSALECAACLDVVVAKRLRNATEVAPGKTMLEMIVNQLYGLRRRLEPDVVQEEPAGYSEGAGTV
ncbi:MAG: four helix bundle protein [Opitutales bacterium]